MPKEKPEIWLSIPWYIQDGKTWGSLVILEHTPFDISNIEVGDTTIRVTKKGIQSYWTITEIVDKDDDGVYCRVKKYKGVYNRRLATYRPSLTSKQLIDAQIMGIKRAFRTQLRNFLDLSETVEEMDTRMEEIREAFQKLWINCVDYSVEGTNTN